MSTKKKKKARKAKAQRSKADAKRTLVQAENTASVVRAETLPPLHATQKASQQSLLGWQIRPNDGQGQYTRFFKSHIPRKVDAHFYEFLREAIPIIDAAIQRLTELDGHLIVTGDNDLLVEEIQQWMDDITVNDIQKGILAFDQSFSSEAHEQGFSISEYVTNKRRNDIVGLRVADSKFIKFRRIPSGLEISQKGNDDSDYSVLKPDNLMYFSINNENQNPYGTALMRSCEFVSKLLVTIQNSSLNVWERFGDPSFSLIYKTSNKDGKDHTARRDKLEKNLKDVIAAKRAGKSGDFVYAIDKDSEITIEIIGADNQILELEQPNRMALEHIVAKTGLPPWMLGLHWSTTERLSDAEANMLLAAVKTRQAAKTPRYCNLISNLLLLRGRTWKPGDWDIEWAQINLHDIEKQAKANFLNSQAEMMNPEKSLKSKNRNRKPEIKEGDCTCGCKKTEAMHSTLDKWHQSIKVARASGDCERIKELEKEFDTFGIKELLRTTPWPQLAEVEDNYERELKYDWSILAEQTFTILNLPTDVLFAVPKPTPREEQLTNPKSEIRNPLPVRQAGKSKAPEGLPAIETFAFTPEQTAAIMQELEAFMGKYDWRSEDSAVRWYYGQAYSLGLIQAANLIGKDRPILSVIKNKEVFDKLAKKGFTLVKNNATKGIINKIIPEMEAQMLVGANPRNVAARLKARFGESNADWERLARTEMTIAAENAKLDEWKEWKIKKIEFVPAPDACPICLRAAGIYDINNAPIPGVDTHPRCLCSLLPVETK